MALLQNALKAAELNELDDPEYERDALNELIPQIFKMIDQVGRRGAAAGVTLSSRHRRGAIDQVEPLVLRFREATKVEREKDGFCHLECEYIIWSARLHEVLCLCTPRWEPLLTASSLLAARPSRICHRVIRARYKPHAPVEPCALCRRAGSLMRPRGRCALCSTW